MSFRARLCKFWLSNKAEAAEHLQHWIRNVTQIMERLYLLAMFQYN
jgi:hypothetical protein